MLRQAFRRFAAVPLYETPEYSKLAAISGDFITEANTAMGGKYTKFVPFYLESRLTSINKKYVLKMDYLPDTEQLEVTSLQLGGLFTEHVPAKEIIPVTEAEYETSHMLGKMLHPADFYDLEMVYLNWKDKEFYVFDKEAEWKEEGLAHPGLSMEKRFHEHKWMDFTSGPRTDINGGKRWVDP